MPLTDDYLLAQHERDMDEDRDFEDRAETAGCALTELLRALKDKPQHERGPAYVALVDDIFTGNAYGLARLNALLAHLAQDVDREPSEMLIRWHERL